MFSLEDGVLNIALVAAINAIPKSVTFSYNLDEGRSSFL